MARQKRLMGVVASEGFTRGAVQRRMESRKKQLDIAVCEVQRVYRGHLGRRRMVATRNLKWELRLSRAAVIIQRAYLDMLDRQWAKYVKKGNVQLLSGKAGSRLHGAKAPGGGEMDVPTVKPPTLEHYSAARLKGVSNLQDGVPVREFLSPSKKAVGPLAPSMPRAVNIRRRWGLPSGVESYDPTTQNVLELMRRLEQVKEEREGALRSVATDTGFDRWLPPLCPHPSISLSPSLPPCESFLPPWHRCICGPHPDAPQRLRLSSNGSSGKAAGEGSSASGDAASGRPASRGSGASGRPGSKGGGDARPASRSSWGEPDPAPAGRPLSRGRGDTVRGPRIRPGSGGGLGDSFDVQRDRRVSFGGGGLGEFRIPTADGTTGVGDYLGPQVAATFEGGVRWSPRVGGGILGDGGMFEVADELAGEGAETPPEVWGTEDDMYRRSAGQIMPDYLRKQFREEQARWATAYKASGVERCSGARCLSFS